MVKRRVVDERAVIYKSASMTDCDTKVLRR